MTIQEIMTLPDCWQDCEVVVYYKSHHETPYTLCSDEDGFYLTSIDGVIIREYEELGDNVDRLQISIVC